MCQKNYVHKKFWPKKGLGTRQFWLKKLSPRKFKSKTNWVKKLILVQENLGQQQQPQCQP